MGGSYPAPEVTEPTTPAPEGTENATEPVVTEPSTPAPEEKSACKKAAERSDLVCVTDGQKNLLTCGDTCQKLIQTVTDTCTTDEDKLEDGVTVHPDFCGPPVKPEFNMTAFNLKKAAFKVSTRVFKAVAYVAPEDPPTPPPTPGFTYVVKPSTPFVVLLQAILKSLSKSSPTKPIPLLSRRTSKKRQKKALLSLLFRRKRIQRAFSHRTCSTCPSNSLRPQSQNRR